MTIAGFILVSCAEQTQTTNVNPDGATRIAPLSAREVRRAKAALHELPTAPDGWVNAVVIEEDARHRWWRIITPVGVRVLEEAYSDADLGALIAPGDAIRYSTKGNDFRVSAKNEVVVLGLAVTEAT